MKKILAFASLALLALACSKEDNAPKGMLLNNDGDKTVFYASFEKPGVSNAPGTKVYADEDLSLLWNEDDRISIFNKRTFNEEYAFIGEDGDNSGSFEPVPYTGFSAGNDLELIYAVYPYLSRTQINNAGTKITVNLPSVQTFKEHSFGIGANTMIAVTDSYYLSFKNACGYLKFRFYGNNISVSSITLEGNNGEKISGKAYVFPMQGGSPTIEMDITATGSITLNCSDPVTLGTSSTDFTEFIFVIPPTTFSNGFSVRIIDDLGRFFEKSTTKSLTIARNKMESMGVMKVSPNYNYVQFEDANFKSYCISNYDTDGDGEISFAEAENITRIDIYTQNPDIASLKGIEYFNNLAYLRCRGRDSTSRIGKLTYLDLSSNHALQTLSCNNNQMTSLDVSGCPALLTLNCQNNQMSSLDLSGCPSLQSVKCYTNLLSSLDLSTNTALSYLDCANNQLSALNLTACTSLTELACRENDLTSLDVSHNLALKKLNAWPQNGTLATVVKKAGKTISYYYVNSIGGWTKINPSSYGTTIVEVD